MRLCYVLLSPTWGMHQYTAGLANRRQAAGDDVCLVTTRLVPRDRYAPGINVQTPISTRDSGFSVDGMRLNGVRAVVRSILDGRPELVHITGPHLWNVPLLHALRREGLPTVHSLHDLHPHPGAVYGRLLYLWNAWVRRGADEILVHGRCHREELVAQGMNPLRVTFSPLTHLFVGYTTERELSESPPEVSYEPWALFFGRFEKYKGLGDLVEAARRLDGKRTGVVLAGPGELELPAKALLPDNVEVRNHLVGDEEALELFRRCGVVVLPYVEASQSALVAAAYFFQKPVIVTDVGALPEYVVEGETGWVVAASDALALADALREALNKPDRLARMGLAGRAWYDEQWRAEGAVLDAVYGRLATRL